MKTLASDALLQRYSEKSEQATGKLDKQIKDIRQRAKDEVAALWKKYKEDKSAGKRPEKSVVKVFSAAIWAKANLEMAPLNAKKYEIKLQLWKRASSELGEKLLKEAERAKKDAAKKPAKKAVKPTKRPLNRGKMETMLKKLGYTTASLKKMSDDDMYDTLQGMMLK